MIWRICRARCFRPNFFTGSKIKHFDVSSNLSCTDPECSTTYLPSSALPAPPAKVKAARAAPAAERPRARSRAEARAEQAEARAERLRNAQHPVGGKLVTGSARSASGWLGRAH